MSETYSGTYSELGAQISTEMQTTCMQNEVFLHELHGVERTYFI